MKVDCVETTNKEIVYCQKVLHLLENLQKVQQSIESFAEHSDKQKNSYSSKSIIDFKISSSSYYFRSRNIFKVVISSFVGDFSCHIYSFFVFCSDMIPKNLKKN